MDQKNAIESIARRQTFVGRIASAMRRLKSDTRGNTLTIFAMSVVPIIGCVGIGLDMAQWVLWKRQLHTAADMAALAGASANTQGHQVKTAVQNSLDKNKLRDFNVMAIETPPTVGSYAGDSSAVRVLLQTQQVLPFSSIFLPNPPVVDAEAVAIAVFESPNCVIALDTSGTALTIAGSASIDMNCALSSNSDFAATASSPINAAALSATGTVTTGGSVTPETKINDGVGLTADPYANRISPPDVSGVCSGARNHTTGSNRVETISPGCYTGITVRGELTLSPGTYYIDAGNFTVGSGGLLKGTGVTIIFTNSDPGSSSIGKFSANGNSVVNLSASTSGDYEGILMYQDPRATPGNGSNFYLTGTTGTDNAGGTITSQYQGAIYTPSTYPRFSGNSSIQTPCMQIVAMRVEFIGNTTVENNCPAGSGASSYGGGKILRLVE